MNYRFATWDHWRLKVRQPKSGTAVQYRSRELLDYLLPHPAYVFELQAHST